MIFTSTADAGAAVPNGERLADLLGPNARRSAAKQAARPELARRLQCIPALPPFPSRRMPEAARASDFDFAISRLGASLPAARASEPLARIRFPHRSARQTLRQSTNPNWLKISQQNPLLPRLSCHREFRCV